MPRNAADLADDLSQIGRFIITALILLLGFVCVLRHVDIQPISPIMGLALGHYLGADGKSKNANG